MRASTVIVFVAVLALSLSAQENRDDHVLHLGDQIPEFVLTPLSGGPVKTTNPGAGGLIVAFLRHEHDSSSRMAETIKKAVHDVCGDSGGPTLVAVIHNSADKAPDTAPWQGFRVVDDKDRRAYGLFQVVVTPTVYLLDSTGHMTGRYAYLPPRLHDSLVLDLKLMTGRISAAEHKKMHQDLAGHHRSASPRTGAALSLARLMYRKGQYKQILTLEKKRQGKHRPQGIHAIFILAALKLDRLEEARRVAALLAQTRHLSPLSHYALAQLCFREKKCRKALDHLNLAIEQDARDAVLFLARGRVYRGLGESDKALRDVLKAAELSLGDKLPH